MNAAQSPLNTRSAAALQTYLELAATDLKARPSVREPVRERLSRLLGGHPSDYALMTSTGAGISTVAAGLDLQPGDNIVLPALEHWNNTFPWLRRRSNGVEVQLVEPDAEHRVTPDAILEKVDAHTRVIATTAVRFDTGFRADLHALSRIAQGVDALFVVDGIQCAGAHPMHVQTDGIDVLACGGFKWLLGMAGTGFLYTNKRARARLAPVAPGMFAAKHDFRALNYHADSRQFETGSLAYALFHGWNAGLSILEDIGIENIQSINLSLTDQIVAGLNSLNIEVHSPHERPEERSAIVSFTMGSMERNMTCALALQDQNVLISNRGESLRISPNFYNRSAEIDRFLNCLESQK